MSQCSTEVSFYPCSCASYRNRSVCLLCKSTDQYVYHLKFGGHGVCWNIGLEMGYQILYFDNFFFHTIKMLHILKQSCSFQLQFCLSMCGLPIFFNVVKYQRVFFNSVKRHLNIKLSSFLHNHQSFCIYILILIFNNISVSKWTW